MVINILYRSFGAGRGKGWFYRPEGIRSFGVGWLSFDREGLEAAGLPIELADLPEITGDFPDRSALRAWFAAHPQHTAGIACFGDFTDSIFE